MRFLLPSHDRGHARLLLSNTRRLDIHTAESLKAHETLQYCKTQVALSLGDLLRHLNFPRDQTFIGPESLLHPLLLILSSIDFQIPSTISLSRHLLAVPAPMLYLSIWVDSTPLPQPFTVSGV